jgi:myo-inositol-1(or 4)-monophosphatase
VSWRYLAVAIEAALRAGRIQRERYGSGVAVELKGEIDLVTEVDRACELAILEAIRSRYPGHDIVTEETDLARTGSRHVWYVDPLDGTTNFAHAYPMFCVSIALVVDREIVAGVV